MCWSWKRPTIPEKYRPWLAENQWWLNTLVLALIACVLVVAFQKDNWAPWMGFREKTTWDWLDLLGVPLTLAILGYILQQQERSRAEKLSRVQQNIAASEAQEEILQVYIDRISTLLVDKNILAIAAKMYSSPEKQGDDQAKTTIPLEERELFDVAVDVIRARTLAILRRFEGDIPKKNSVIRFLIEAEVISKAKLPLRGALLGGANLSGANLSGADLSSANLSSAYLRGADLRGGVLIRAGLRGACLEWADLGDIKWDNDTEWPDASEVASAKNIPKALKQQLRITDTPRGLSSNGTETHANAKSLDA
jgi:hypothetical protein